MPRTPHQSPSRRRRATLHAGAVISLASPASLFGATTADATPNVTDLEGTILRIGGSAVTGTNPIPSGRTLTPVQLTTSDPELHGRGRDHPRRLRRSWP